MNKSLTSEASPRQTSLYESLDTLGIAPFHRDETIDDDDRASFYSMDFRAQHWAPKVDEFLSQALLLLVLGTVIVWGLGFAVASKWPSVDEFMRYPAVILPLLAVVAWIIIHELEKLGLGELSWRNLTTQGIHVATPASVSAMLEKIQVIPNHKVVLAGWCFRQGLREWWPIWIYVYIERENERRHVATFSPKKTLFGEDARFPWLLRRQT